MHYYTETQSVQTKRNKIEMEKKKWKLKCKKKKEKKKKFAFYKPLFSICVYIFCLFSKEKMIIVRALWSFALLT